MHRVSPSARDERRAVAQPERGILRPMKYADGLPVELGDIVSISLADGSAKARVVMLGDTREHLDIEAGFVQWVERENLIEPSQVIVEWLDRNPFAHGDPQYAPVGQYLFTGLDCCVRRVDA